MILQQAKTENLKEGDIARYQGRLVLISGDRHEYGELAHSLFDVLYLENGAVDIANWMHLEGVGEITKDELTAIMRVFVHHMTVLDAIAKVFAYHAMREVEHEQR